MNWKKQLEKFQLNESDLSIRIKNKIKDYNGISEGIDEIKGQMDAEGISQEQADDLQGNLDSLETALNDLDESLCNDITKYNKNKEMYAEKAKNLKHQKAKNTTEKSSENQDKSVTQEKMEGTVISKNNSVTAPSSITTNVSDTVVVPNVVSNNEEVVVEKIVGLENNKKKGISTSSLILGGVLLVLSFGAYNYFTKND